ncbi:MAG: FAD-dependent oxidoreductase [Deltaproteobacteria bacterium]|nr:FAD-dependent oxidoreductase [Deltaproteobacteria bacterium]
MDLFSPIHLKGVKFKNRAVMAPMVLNLAGTDGSVTEAFRDFYLARARGGVGYIILGATFVHPHGRGFGRQLGIDRDGLIPGLAALAHAIGGHSRIGVQLSFKSIGRMAKDFTLDEIRSYRQAFVKAAIRAKDSGFDAIELHACHDYWLNFFLSPHFNTRTDEYGASLENRFRLLRETVEEIVSAVGPDLILGVRLSMVDFLEGVGLNLDETIEFGRRLEALGVNYLSASAGIGFTQYRMSPPCEVPRGRLLVYGRALQQVVSIPVIGVGRLDRPNIFREAVEGGYVNMAAVGRALIADPDFVEKIRQGREDEIRPCLACYGCLTCLHKGESVRCAVNPMIGRDFTQLPPLSSPRRVLVVGGGPAGLSAAAAAAERGADVVLAEKRTEAGGALAVAARPPFKDAITDLNTYLIKKAEAAGVRFELGREITPETVLGFQADDVIIATGALSIRPECIDPDDRQVVDAEEILSKDSIVAGRYLVIGGGVVGLETADYLADRRAEVTVVEMLEQMGQGLGPKRLTLVFDRLLKMGVNLLTKTRVLSVRDGMAKVSIGNNETVLGPFDSVVIAVGYRSDSRLAEALEGRVRVRVIGDACRPRSICEAITEGLDAALALEDGAVKPA